MWRGGVVQQCVTFDVVILKFTWLTYFCVQHSSKPYSKTLFNRALCIRSVVLCLHVRTAADTGIKC